MSDKHPVTTGRFRYSNPACQNLPRADQHMSAPSDEKLYAVWLSKTGYSTLEKIRAVAEAAIAADRAARAEPVGEVIETWSCVNGHEQGTERIVQWADERNPPPVGAKVYTATPAAPVVPDGWKLVPSRCPMCSYQHGHQIGCENNPVDIALRAAAPAPSQEPTT